MKERQDELNEEYASLVAKAADRRSVLERSLELQLFLRNAEQQGSWIRDFVNVLLSNELGRDLTHAISLQEKHKVGGVAFQLPMLFLSSLQSFYCDFRESKRYEFCLLRQFVSVLCCRLLRQKWLANASASMLYARQAMTWLPTNTMPVRSSFPDCSNSEASLKSLKVMWLSARSGLQSLLPSSR